MTLIVSSFPCATFIIRYSTDRELLVDTREYLTMEKFKLTFTAIN